jgi:hypothetical protein
MVMSRRAVAGLLAMGAMLAFILTSCPSQRDGMSGQLATAKDETQSAARSGALAIDLWAQRRSTRNLTSVQLVDARDDVVEAYGTIAALKATNSVDLDRQALLARAMAGMIDVLGDANAAVRAISGQPDPRALRQSLLARADALERDYR